MTERILVVLLVVAGLAGAAWLLLGRGPAAPRCLAEVCEPQTQVQLVTYDGTNWLPQLTTTTVCTCTAYEQADASSTPPCVDEAKPIAPGYQRCASPGAQLTVAEIDGGLAMICACPR